MSKHTPGPWAQDPTGDIGWWQIGTLDRPVATVDAGDFWPIAEAQANARLIAAAPEMLAACRMVLEMAVAWQPLTPGDIAEVKAAVAKAEGGA
jgi:hypothetical protein